MKTNVPYIFVIGLNYEVDIGFYRYCSTYRT